MSSFFQTTEQATTDIQDRNNKFLTQLKTYTFFVFYNIPEAAHANRSNSSTQSISKLNKMDFKLTGDKPFTTDHSQLENNKQIEIRFYDLDNQDDVLEAVSDVRGCSHSSKAKIVINASEGHFTNLLLQLQEWKVDISSIPIILNSTNYKSDLSYFLGWNDEIKEGIASQSLPYYQQSARNWIKATTEKIDIWRAEVSVSKQVFHLSNVQNGRIFKVQGSQLKQLENQKHLSQCFASHLCIGYHADLLLKYKKKIKGNQKSFGNSFTQAFEKFKKFCCVGQKNMKKTTGIVNISLIDEKGEELQILKQLRPGDSSEQESQVDIGSKAAKYHQYKDVLSILLTNLNIFQGNQLDKSVEGKIYDNKLELLTFNSQKGHKKICSSESQIKIKFDANRVDLQIGQTGYILEHPDEIKISFYKKIKIGIHSQQVKC